MLIAYNPLPSPPHTYTHVAAITSVMRSQCKRHYRLVRMSTRSHRQRQRDKERVMAEDVGRVSFANLATTGNSSPRMPAHGHTHTPPRHLHENKRQYES
jgi:hypothetical protein